MHNCASLQHLILCVLASLREIILREKKLASIINNSFTSSLHRIY